MTLDTKAIIDHAKCFHGGTFSDFWALIRPAMTDEQAEQLCQIAHAIFDAGFAAQSRYADPVIAERLQRYGYLAGLRSRNDDEESEVQALLQSLLFEGVGPGWLPVERVRS